MKHNRQIVKKKTPRGRVSIDTLLKCIRRTSYLKSDDFPYLTIAVLQCHNGHIMIGKSAPMYEDQYEELKGRELAYQDALRQLWELEGYLSKQRRYERS